MSQFDRFKPFPKLEELDPGIESGWDFDFLALRAEPETTSKGGIILSDLTKDQEAAASTRWMIVDISPTAFMSQDWERALAEGLDPQPKSGRQERIEALLNSYI